MDNLEKQNLLLVEQNELLKKQNEQTQRLIEVLTLGFSDMDKRDTAKYNVYDCLNRKLESMTHCLERLNRMG